MGLEIVHTVGRGYYEDSYGGKEYYQGDNEIYRIWQLDGGDRHFKQEGRQPSYGDAEWHDEMTEVTPRTKVVTAYDYEDV